MLIQRNNVIVRPGCMEDAVALIKGEIERTNVKARVLTPVFGPFDRLVFEARFESLTEFDKFWQDWFALPTTQQFFEQWPVLFLPGGMNELWEAREPMDVLPAGKIVNRRTFLVKSGKMEEVVALLVGERQETYPYEISTANLGPNDTLAMDMPFESITAHDQAWEEWGKSERAGQFFEKWFQVVEAGGANEIWQVR